MRAKKNTLCVLYSSPRQISFIRRLRVAQLSGDRHSTAVCACSCHFCPGPQHAGQSRTVVERTVVERKIKKLNADSGVFLDKGVVGPSLVLSGLLSVATY